MMAYASADRHTGSRAVVGELTRSLSPTRIGSATMLATEILARSGTEPDCADILGVSRSVVREASR